MLRSSKKTMGRPLYILSPGDYYATDENAVLGTVTGSSVVVCLHDTLRGIGAMRHIVVPGSIGTEGIIANDLARYTINSMELLFGELVKLGGERKRLTGKIFGASYLNDVDSRLHGISISTVKFLHEYFSYEKIPVMTEDLGGRVRRKIFFIVRTGQVYRKLLHRNEESSEFIRMEKEFIEAAFRDKNTSGRVILFE